jgi:soluble lytic murein transglycosylase-like protein
MKSVDVLALIRSSSQKHRVPEAFVKSIVAAESSFNSTVVSSAGAVGLMQVMPETAHEFGADPSIPEQNVDAGTR